MQFICMVGCCLVFFQDHLRTWDHKISKHDQKHFQLKWNPYVCIVYTHTQFDQSCTNYFTSVIISTTSIPSANLYRINVWNFINVSLNLCSTLFTLKIFLENSVHTYNGLRGVSHFTMYMQLPICPSVTTL